jgi:hypothetical protein
MKWQFQQICEAKHAALDNDLETLLKIDFSTTCSLS